MTQFFTLWDDVAVGLIPAHAQFVGVYIDGNFRTEAAARAAFPRAYLFTITVHGQPGARCADCENGDLTAAQAAAWAHEEINAGRHLPWLYASRDNVPALLAALKAVGVSRNEVLVWSAHYTGSSHLCAPSTCRAAFTANATQFTDHAQGHSLDESVFAVDPKPMPKPPDRPHGHAKFSGTVDLATGKLVGVHGLPGLGVHFAGPERWLDVHVQVQVGRGGGQWRAKP